MPCKMFQWELKGLKKGTKPAHSPASKNRAQSEVPSTSRIYEDAGWFSATGSGSPTSLAAPSDRCRSATEKKTLDTATPSEKSLNRVTDSSSDPAPAVLKKKSKGAAFNLKITSVRISSHLKFSKKNKKVPPTPPTCLPLIVRPLPPLDMVTNVSFTSVQTSHRESDAPVSSFKKTKKRLSRMFSSISNRITNITKTPNIYNEQEIKSDLPSTGKIGDDAEQQETFAESAVLKKKSKGTAFNLKITSVRISSHLKCSKTNKKVDATNLPATDRPSTSTTGHGHKSSHKESDAPVSSFKKTKKRLSRMFSSINNSVNRSIKTINNKQENISDLPSTSGISDKCDKECHPSSTNLPASDDHPILTCIRKSVASTEQTEHVSVTSYIKTPVIYKEQETTSDLPSANGIDEDAEQKETFAVDKEATSNTSNTPELDDHPILTSIEYPGASVEQTEHVSNTSTTGFISGSPTSLAAPSDGCRSGFEQETLPIATVSNAQKQRRLSDKWLPYQEKKKELDEDKKEPTATNPSSTNLPASTCKTSLTPVSPTSSPAPSASRRRVYRISSSNFNSATGWIKTQVIYNLQENVPDLPSTSRIRDKWLLYQNIQNELNKDKEESTATNTSSTNPPASTFKTSLTLVSPTSSPAPSASTRKVFKISFSNSKWIKTPVIYNKQETTSDLPPTSGIDEDAEQQETFAVDKEAIFNTSNTPQLDDHPILTSIKYLVAYVEQTKHVSITSTTGLVSGSPTGLAAPSDGCRGASEQETLPIATVSNEQKQPSWNNQVLVTDLPSTRRFSDKWLPFQHMKKELNEDKEESTATNPSSTNPPASTSITSLTPVSLTSLPAPSASTRRLFSILFNNSNSVTSWIKTPVIYNKQETTSDLPSTSGIDKNAEQQETFAVDKEATSYTSNTPELDDHPILTSIEYPVTSVEQTEHVSNTSTTGLVSGSPTGLAAPSDGCRDASEQETLPIATLRNEQKQPSWNIQVLVTDLPSTCGLSAKWLPHQNMKELDEDKEESTATNPSSTNPPASTCITSLTPVSPTSSPAPSASRRRVYRISSSNFNSATGWTITPVLYIEQETTSDLPSTNGIDEDAEQQETFAVDKEATSYTSNTPQLDDHPILSSIKYPVASVEQTEHVSNTSTTGLVSGSPTSLAAPSDGCRSGFEQETLPIATVSNEQKQRRLSDKWLPYQEKKKELDEDKKEPTATNPSSTNLPASTCKTSLTPVSPTSSPAPSASRRRVYRISSSNFNSATGWIKTQIIYNLQENVPDLPSTSRIRDKWLLYQNIQNELNKDKEESTATNTSSTNPPASTFKTSLTLVSPTSSPAPSASTRKVFKISFSNSKWIKTPVIYNEQETTSDLPSTSGIDEDAEQQETFAVDKEAIFNTSNTPELDDHPILTSIKYLVAYVEQTEHVSNTSTTGLVSGSPTGLAAPSDGCRGASEQETLPIATVSNEQKQPSWNNQVLVTDLPSTSGLSAKWLPYQNMKKQLDEDKEESTTTNPSSTNPPASTCITSLTPVSPTSSPAPSASRRRVYRISFSNFNSTTGWIKTPVIYNLQENVPDLPSTSRIRDKWLLYQNIQNELNKDKEESTATNTSSTNLPASTFITSLTPVSPTSSPAPSASTRKVFKISFSNSKWIKTPVIYNEQETTSDLPSTNGIDEDAEQQETFAVDKEAIFNTSNTPELDDHSILTSIKYLVAYVEQTEHVSNTSTTGLVSGSPTGLAAPSDGCRGASEQETLPIATVSNEQKQPSWNNQVLVTDLPSTSGLSAKWLPYQNMKKELDEDKEESTATNPSSTNPPASTSIASLTPVSPTSSPAPSASRRRVVRISSSNFNSATGWTITPVLYIELETTSDLPSTNGIDEDAEQQETFAVDKEATSNTSNTPQLDDHPILTSIEYPVASVEQTKHVSNTSTTGLVSGSPTGLAAPSDGCRGASEQETLAIATVSNAQKQPSWNNLVLVTDNSSDSMNENESDQPSTSGLSDKWLPYQNMKKDKEESTATNPSSTNLPASTCKTSLTPVSPTSSPAPSDGCRGASEQETLPIATVSSERKLPSWIGPLFKFFIIYNRITSFQIPFLPN